MKSKAKIPLGSIWQDRDSRMFRFVVVFETLRSGRIRIRNVTPPEGFKQPSGTVDAPVGRETDVSPESFTKRFKRVP